MDLAERLADVDARIATAMRASNRADETVTRIVVTKFHPASLVEELVHLGVRDVGENRQQELRAKREALPAVDVRWHFVGQVQTNKARVVRADADAVHSLDRVRLADAFERAAEADRLDVLVQVNLTSDPARGGVQPNGVEELATHIAQNCPSLRLRGVMAVAPLDEPAERAFARLAETARMVRAVDPGADWISAGMTGDFVEAIAAGATHLRIGSAITGPRPLPG